MVQKSIAALVVASLCWLSVPLGSLRLGAPPFAQKNTAAAEDHSCCPRIHPRVAATLFASVMFPAMPCGAQHPCCARQAPANSITVPVEATVVRPSAESVSAIDTISRSHGRVVEPLTVCFLSPPFERSTVLRI